MGKSSINNTNNSDETSISLRALRNASFGFSGPFQVVLPDQSVIYCDKVVRILPKRRLVVFGEWQGKAIVAKLFYDSKAKYHLERDMLGIKKLVENSIPTPKLYYDGPTADKHIRVLIFERILEAKSLDEIWHSKVDIQSCEQELRTMTIELATQHVYGILQHDLHMKNFLVKNSTIYTLDGAQIEVFPEPLDKKESMTNLALFFSQLGVGSSSLITQLFHLYAEARGWLLKKDDTKKLHEEVKSFHQSRWGKFEKKIFRSCTDFVKLETFNTYSMYDRVFDSPNFLSVLHNPDKIFSHPKARILKDGGSSTVIEIAVDHRHLVIKRYNNKNAWHWVRRLLRTTRAERCWYAAHKLRFFDIDTARPVAFVEKSFLGVHQKSYFISEYIQGERADEFFVNHSLHSVDFFPTAERIINAISNIAKLNMTHGDLKITNIIIDPLKRPVLIDLDGVRHHKNTISLHRTVHKELKRFLDNFRERPNIYNALLRLVKQQ